MKKLLPIILFILIIPINIKALENTDIKLNQLFEHDMYKIDNIRYHLQGYTITDKYIVLGCRHADNDHYLVLYDKDTYKYVNAYHFDNLGHANDMTYNSKTKKIVVVNNITNNFIIINAETFVEEQVIPVTPSENKATSIAYYKEKDGYIIRQYYKDEENVIKSKAILLDNSFNYISEFNIQTFNQGAGIFNNHYYTVNYILQTDQNYIRVYDLNTKQLVKQYFKDDANYHELEGIEFDENGKMILGFNNPENKISFYSLDFDAIEYTPIMEVYKNKETPKTGEYEFGIYDEKEKLIQKKTNIENIISFDAINIEEIGIKKYYIKRICENNCDNEKFEMILNTTYDTFNNVLNTKVTYDNSEKLIYNEEKKTILDYIQIVNVPNTKANTSLHITLLGISLITFSYFMKKLLT